MDNFEHQIKSHLKMKFIIKDAMHGFLSLFSVPPKIKTLGKKYDVNRLKAR